MNLVIKSPRRWKTISGETCYSVSRFRGLFTFVSVFSVWHPVFVSEFVQYGKCSRGLGPFSSQGVFSRRRAEAWNGHHVLIHRDLSPPGPSCALHLSAYLNVDHLVAFDQCRIVLLWGCLGLWAVCPAVLVDEIYWWFILFPESKYENEEIYFNGPFSPPLPSRVNIVTWNCWWHFLVP